MASRMLHVDDVVTWQVEVWMRWWECREEWIEVFGYIFYNVIELTRQEQL